MIPLRHSGTLLGDIGIVNKVLIIVIMNDEERLGFELFNIL
jgi:hypothetical protein